MWGLGFKSGVLYRSGTDPTIQDCVFASIVFRNLHLLRRATKPWLFRYHFRKNV